MNAPNTPRHSPDAGDVLNAFFSRLIDEARRSGRAHEEPRGFGGADHLHEIILYYQPERGQPRRELVIRPDVLDGRPILRLTEQDGHVMWDSASQTRGTAPSLGD